MILDPNSDDVIDPPIIKHSIYVDATNGNDENDGKSEDSALKTLKAAGKMAISQTEILVKNGEYTNSNFGNGKKDNGLVMHISDITDIRIANFPGHSPILKFDGSGGISMNNVTWLIPQIS